MVQFNFFTKCYLNFVTFMKKEFMILFNFLPSGTPINKPMVLFHFLTNISQPGILCREKEIIYFLGGKFRGKMFRVNLRKYEF